jgi:methylmalonyl-CoA mutase N-terminal domain/subunit
MATIDAKGGAIAAIESGYVQQVIHEAAYGAQLSVDRGDSVVVGVNRFAESTGGTAHIDTFSPLDAEGEREQIERVRAVRAQRSDSEWRAAIDGVAQAARDGSNLVPSVIAAVEARATLGEIADALRGVFGEYQGLSSPQA